MIMSYPAHRQNDGTNDHITPPSLAEWLAHLQLASSQLSELSLVLTENVESSQRVQSRGRHCILDGHRQSTVVSATQPANDPMLSTCQSITAGNPQNEACWLVIGWTDLSQFYSVVLLESSVI